MRIQSNLRKPLVERFRKVLAAGETEAGLIASAVAREIIRREKGGKVIVAERKSGRPKKVESE